VAIVALIPVGLASFGSTMQANASTSMVSTSKVVEMRSTHLNVQVLGICTLNPSDVSIFRLQQSNISTCGTCLDIGQIGEDQGLWENFQCWQPSTLQHFQLWVQDGPTTAIGQINHR
jgi:hypothetical protein